MTWEPSAANTFKLIVLNYGYTIHKSSAYRIGVDRGHQLPTTHSAVRIAEKLKLYLVQDCPLDVTPHRAASTLYVWKLYNRT